MKLFELLLVAGRAAFVDAKRNVARAFLYEFNDEFGAERIIADRLAFTVARADAAERAAARNANVALLSSGLLAIGLEAALLRFFL